MSALLKIITDVDCDLYVDFEYKEHLTVGKMSKLEIQRGTYILEFKIDDVTIHSEDYYVPSNNEELLYNFKFIHDNESRIIIYEVDAEPRCCTSECTFEDTNIVTTVKCCEPRILPNIKENAFDQTILLHTCNENGHGMIIFKEIITAIGDLAFAGNRLYKITIPSGIKSIGKGAFYGCHWVSFYGKYATQDHRCLIIDDTLLACADAGLDEYWIPENIRVIGDYVFRSSMLKNIYLPNGLKSVGIQAFFGCPDLKGLTLPSNIKSIGVEAFCGNSYTIHSKSTNPPILNGRIMWHSTKIFVPSGCQSAYRSEWSRFGHFFEIQ